MENEKKFITMEDGREAKLYDNSTLHEFFREKFPDGITVEMPDEGLTDLQEYNEMKITGDFHNLGLTEFWGKINNTRGYLEYAGEGILRAEMRLKPDDYRLIMPEDTYANRDNNVGCEDLDWDVKAATTFAHVHGQDTDDMTVEVTKGIESLRCLYIEGRSFAEVMDTVRKTGCNSEQELKQLIALMDIRDKGVDSKNPIPEILEPLFRRMPGYDKLGSDLPKVREQKILLEAEKLLDRVGLKRESAFTLTAEFDEKDNNRAAREVVAAVNRTSMADAVHKGFALATRNGNRVEVSVSTANSERALDIEGMVRTHPDCMEWNKVPRKAELNRQTYVVLSTGQAVSGYLNMESLFKGYDYTLKHTGVDGNIQSMKVLNQPGNADRYNLFTSNDPIRFPQGYGENDGIHVQYMLDAAKFLDAHLIRDISFLQSKDDPDKVFINGKTQNAVLTGVRLNPQDTRLFKKTLDTGDWNCMNILKHALASVYYAPAIEMEKQRQQAINQRVADRQAKKEAMLQRITEPELYGKVNDLHIRCVIDGKLQEGRPLKGYDITVSMLKNDAALLNKEYLNYPAHFHQSVLRDMAANTYKDILTGRVEQQQRTRGMRL